MKNILAENMRRFGTKNLSEANLQDLFNSSEFVTGANRDPKTGNLIAQDTDQNNNGYPDGSEGSNNSEFLQLNQALEKALDFQTDTWNSDPGEDIFLVNDESTNSISVELLSGPWRTPALKAIKMVLKKFPNFIIDPSNIHKDSESTNFDIIKK